MVHETTTTSSIDVVDDIVVSASSGGGAFVGSASTGGVPVHHHHQVSPRTVAFLSTTTEDLAGFSPKSQEPATAHLVAGYPHLMPQPGSTAAYYLVGGGAGSGYPTPQQSQMIPPEPPSPATAAMAAVVYDAGSFSQQPGAFAPRWSNANAAGGGSTTPLSPPRPTANLRVLPPASPLFPRVTSGGLLVNSNGSSQAGGAGVAPQLGNTSASSMYQQYSTVQTVGSNSSDFPEDGNGWPDRYAPSQTSYQQASPQMMSMSYGGMPGSQTRATVGGRAYSFEEAMLPPSALDPLDQANPSYSPYGASQVSPIPTGATLFAHQSWYGGGPPDMYSSPGSPLQPRPSQHPPMDMYAGTMAGTMWAMPPYGAVGPQYFTASSPGPPIQTTASNKGPDGSNLFIFHIPNHFTNLDMYQLFCPYGNLLSVRIMVEKDTGRSRGFGFVSYDNPESAALAIKELNGFPIGNKRLKVHHKQIRPKDLHNGGGVGGRENSQYDAAPPGGSDGGGASAFPRPQFSSSSLPPSGPMASASQNMWYNNKQSSSSSGGAPAGVVDGAVSSSSSEGVVGMAGGVGNPTDEGTESNVVTTSSTPGGTEVHNEASLQASPLASLGSLQSALPDVSGNGVVTEHSQSK